MLCDWQALRAASKAHKFTQMAHNLEAFVTTTFVLETEPRSTTDWYRRGDFQGTRVLTQLWVALRLKHPIHHAQGGTQAFSQY